MAMKKYAQGEGELEVFRGEEAVVVNQHMSKLGRAVSDFTDAEKIDLQSDLDALKPQEQEAPKADAKPSAKSEE
jgi:hypothetical protein